MMKLMVKKMVKTMTKDSSGSEKKQKDRQSLWEHWFEEIELLKPLPVKKKLARYVQALIKKSTKQGLELSP